MKVGCVTLQAARDDGLVEIWEAVGITRAVDPLTAFCPVGHWHFEELISVPIKISLALAPRADHQTEALAAGERVGRWQLCEG